MSTSGETKHDTLGKLKVLQCSWDRETGWVRGFQNDGELKGCTQRGLISHIKEFGLYLKGSAEPLKGFQQGSENELTEKGLPTLGMSCWNITKITGT